MIELTIKMPSESQAGVEYELRRHTDGGYSCSCTDWVTRSGGRGSGYKCKHLREALDRSLFLLEEAAEPLPPSAPAAAGAQQRPCPPGRPDPAAAPPLPPTREQAADAAYDNFLRSLGEQPAPRSPTEIIDGWIVDTVTGEQLGPAALADVVVKDDGSAERVLAEFQALEAERAALRTRLAGFEKWGEAEAKKIDTREAALRRRYLPQLESSQPKSVEWGDEEKALGWAKFGAPEAVKTIVTEKLDKKVLGQLEDLPADIFTVNAPVERFFVKPNVADKAEEAAAT